MYRVVVLVEARPAGSTPAARDELALAVAVVAGIREIERAGGRVVCIGDGGPGSSAVIVAADLILRLREVSATLSEENLLVLLELLPL
jgi:hypothetical protein